ncbi:hypothetical protein GXW82_34695 [Streptacidiphilus sp. 4-A2]|nr:hypothetical protein [Streptacidiphilus sp. 4-A2]
MTGRAQRQIQGDIEALLEDAEVLQDIDDADLDPEAENLEAENLETGNPEAGTGDARGEGSPDGVRNCRHHRPPPTDASPPRRGSPSACPPAPRPSARRRRVICVWRCRWWWAIPRGGRAHPLLGLRGRGDRGGAGLRLPAPARRAHRGRRVLVAVRGGRRQPTAAFCLYLHHRNQGQHWTAQHWRSQVRQLQSSDRPPVRLRPPDSVPLLPREVHQAMLSECYRGAPPQLPPAMEAAINSLYAQQQDGQDPHTEAYPLPRDAFPASLARAAAR